MSDPFEQLGQHSSASLDLDQGHLNSKVFLVWKVFDQR